MKTKNKKGAIVVVVMLSIAAAVYFFVIKKPKEANLTKMDKINNIIMATSAGDYSSMLKFDDAFIEAWYQAVKNGQNIFVLNGRNYNTIGGKAVT